MAPVEFMPAVPKPPCLLVLLGRDALLLALTKTLRPTGAGGCMRRGHFEGVEFRRRRLDVVECLVLRFLSRLIFEIAVDGIVDSELEVRKEHEEAIIIGFMATAGATAMDPKTEERDAQSLNQVHVAKENPLAPHRDHDGPNAEDSHPRTVGKKDRLPD